MDIKGLLKEGDFSFSKRYGQNFITDTNFLEAIVQKSDITAEDTVLEIGAGAGTLTAALCKTAHEVIAFEIDERLSSVLKKTLSGFDNLNLIFEDFMKAENLIELLSGRDYKVVANLPYYITTPILFKLIEDTSPRPRSISVMVQKEVADRLCARPSTKDYGALTVAVEARYNCKKIADAPRTLFMPQPNVDSAVVLMSLKEGAPPFNQGLFSKVVRSGFAMRRKTLLNNLTASFSLNREKGEGLLSECGLSAGIRGEALSTRQFIELTNALERIL